jgi:hypothetical protein
VIADLVEPAGLRDDRGDVGLGGGAVLVVVLDPAAREPSAAAEGVDAPRLEARSTVSAGPAAAWLSPAMVSGTAAARIIPIAIEALAARRPGFVCCCIDVSGGESTMGDGARQ